MKKISLCILLLVAVTVLFACDGAPAVEEVPSTPSPTPFVATPEPVVVEFTFTVTPSPTPPEPTPTPSPTPTPEITPIPFSYYAPTVNMSFEELVGGTADFGEMGSKKVNWPKAYPPKDAYRIIVDVQWQVVMVYTKDVDGNYTVPVRYMLCSTGNPGIKDGGETRRGVFEMMVPRVRFGHFLSGEAAQYWSLIRGRTYFHSILYDKQDNMSTYQEDVYRALGSKASHGCIRLTVPDARWIWYNIPYGAICEIRDGSKDDAETKAIREMLVLPEPPAHRVTVKAGSTPNTDNWSIETNLNLFDPSLLVPFRNEKQPPPAMKSDDEKDESTGSNPSAPATDGGEGTVPPPIPAEPDAPAPVPDPEPPADSGSSSSSDSGSDTGGIEFAVGT